MQLMSLERIMCNNFNLKEEPTKDANEYKKKYALNYTNSILRTRQKDSEFSMEKIIELISYSLGTFFASECYSNEMTQRMIFVVENYNHFTEQQLLDALVNYKEPIPARNKVQ